MLGQLEASVYQPTPVSNTLAAYFIEIDAADGPLTDGDLPWADQASIFVADRLKGKYTNGELLARWGIDQFVVILRGLGLTDSDLRSGAEALLEVLRAPVEVNDHEEKVQVHIGIAKLVDASQWQRLVQQAE